ncbi:hypothetical protein AKJ16_DCAP00226 [Drosera capensis]
MSGGEAENSGFCVLSISETGVCYFWYGKDIEELRSTAPTKISLLLDDGFLKKQKGGFPAIFAAKIQSIFKPAAANVFVAHGLEFKPTFEKIVVHHGNDLKLNIYQDGVLLPSCQSQKAKRRLDAKVERLVVSMFDSQLIENATALNRSNAEGASLPVPKVFEFDNGKKLDGILKKGSDSAEGIGTKDGLRLAEDPSPLHGMEERLRSLGILNRQSDVRQKPVLDPNFKHIDLEETLPEKKMRGIVRSMNSNDAHKLLNSLVTLWQSRLPRTKGRLWKALMKLGGRLQLPTAQIDKASQSKSQILQQVRHFAESDNDDVEEVLYNEEDVSQSCTDADEGS